MLRPHRMAKTTKATPQTSSNVVAQQAANDSRATPAGGPARTGSAAAVRPANPAGVRPACDPTNAALTGCLAGLAASGPLGPTRSVVREARRLLGWSTSPSSHSSNDTNSSHSGHIG